MAAAAYAQDVFGLVQALTRADATRDVISRAPDVDQSATVAIGVYVEAGELRPAIAVQQALQMCVDAAAIVVDAASRDAPDVGLEAVEARLSDHIVELSVVSLSAGSFGGRFTIDPRTETGQRRLLAIGGVTIIALHIAFPPLAPILLAVGVAKELAEIIRPDALPPSEEPPKSIDPVDISSAGAHVEITVQAGGESTTNADGVTRGYIYDVDIHGPSPSNRAFVERVRGLEGVAPVSRAIVGEEYQRIRIWSSQPIDADALDRFASEVGTVISGLSSPT